VERCDETKAAAPPDTVVGSLTGRKGKTNMEHVESTTLPGISKELVTRYGEHQLRRFIGPPGDPRYYFEYDRGTVRDGANITTPFACIRHVADNAKRKWLAVRLLEEHQDEDDKLGTKPRWREVQELPTELRVGGTVA
jgi:hypothetical protein